MIQDKFKDIDPILDKWLPKYGLMVFKEYKDYSVRSIEVIDDSGLSYHIWVEQSGNGGNYTVKAHWDLGKKVNRQRVTKSWEKASTIDQLFDTLDTAYSEVNSWIVSNGNTRNWIK